MDNVRKEIGKWLMDIAKYLTTAVLLSSVFGNMRELWAIYLYTSIAVALTLSVGLWAVRGKNKKEEK